MESRNLLTKILAIVGTVLAWFPILAPILLSVILLLQEGIFRFDFLMPAELFPVVLLGGSLLIWASIRARSRRGLIGWSSGLALGLLIIGQGLAVLTGLASGEMEPGGVWWLLVLASISIYTLAVLLIGVGGILLLRDLFRSPWPPEETLGLS